MGLATFPSYWWMGKIDEVRVARWAYAVFIVGSILSSVGLESFALLSLARAVTGAGAGTLMVLGMTAGAQARNQNRIYASITLGQLASGAIILYLLPALTGDGRGLRGVFYLSALLGVLGLTTTTSFPAVGQRTGPAERKKGLVSGVELKAVLLTIGFALVFNIVVGGLWAFAAEYAAAQGMTQERISRVLAYATAVGIAGAAVAYVVGDGPRRRTPLLVGYLVIMLGASILHFAPGETGFATGCYVLSFGWNFSVPCVLAAVAAQDKTGRSMPSMNLAFAFGLGTGPLLAGAVIDLMGLDALLPYSLAGLTFGTMLMFRVTGSSTVQRFDP